MKENNNQRLFIPAFSAAGHPFLSSASWGPIIRIEQKRKKKGHYQRACARDMSPVFVPCYTLFDNLVQTCQKYTAQGRALKENSANKNSRMTVQ